MRVLLDTHVLLWWHDQPARLTETAYDAIHDLGNDVFISVVNGWEMQIKAQLGKLTLPKPLRVLLHVMPDHFHAELLLRGDVVRVTVLLQHSVLDFPAVLRAGRLAHLRRFIGLENAPGVEALPVKEGLPRTRFPGRLGCGGQDETKQERDYRCHARKVYHDLAKRGRYGRHE